MNNKLVYPLLGTIVIIFVSWVILRKVAPRPNTQPKDINTTNINGTLNIIAPNNVDVTTSFDVILEVDTDGQPVNAVGLDATYDINRLQIIAMDTTESFCEFYPENRFDNQTGTITISCGLPSPGFTGTNRLAKITFESVSVGIADITIQPQSQILLNDGKATNILTQPPTKQINILGKL